MPMLLGRLPADYSGAELTDRSGNLIPTPLLAYQEIDEFTQDVSSRRVQVIHPSARVGTSKWIMRPYVPNINVSFDMFSSRSTFAGGETFHELTTSDADVEQLFDEETGEMVGVYLFDIEVPVGENSYCYRIKTSQKSTYNSAETSAPSAVNGCAAELGLTALKKGIEPLDNPAGKICLNAQERFKRATWKVEVKGDKTVCVSQVRIQNSTTAFVSLEPKDSDKSMEKLEDGDLFDAIAIRGVGEYELTAESECGGYPIYAYGKSIVFKFGTVTNHPARPGAEPQRVGDTIGSEESHHEGPSTVTYIIPNTGQGGSTTEVVEYNNRPFARQFVHGKIISDHVDDEYVVFGAGDTDTDCTSVRMIASTGRGHNWNSTNSSKSISINDSAVKQQVFTVPRNQFENGKITAAFDLNWSNTINYSVGGHSEGSLGDISISFGPVDIPLTEVNWGASSGMAASKAVLIGDDDRKKADSDFEPDSLIPGSYSGSKDLRISFTSSLIERKFLADTVSIPIAYSATITVAAQFDAGLKQSNYSHGEFQKFGVPYFTLNEIRIKE